MKIVIVGGVAGGMSCAARARRLNEHAEIIVLERGEHVSFANCGLPYYVGGEIVHEESLLVQTPVTLKAALNLDVRTNHEVIALDGEAQTVAINTPDGLTELHYDALVLSPGASAIRPSIPGIDSPRVHTLRNVHDAATLHDQLPSVNNVVVLGGGFIGLEAAEALASRGLNTLLVQRSEHILPPLEAELASLVTDEARALNIDIREGVQATAIESHADHDTVVLDDGTHVDAEMIVVAAGVKPDTAPFEQAGIECVNGAIVVDDHGRTSTPRVWATGDAVAVLHAVTGTRRPVALAGPANRGGRQIADDILRPGYARPQPRPLGTAIVRIGEVTAAMTGANRADLTEANIPFRTLHLHPNQHAGYFPGAQQVHLLAHIAPDGRLLGAQAVGRDGVDKRIDVLATAIRARMAVEDLIDLDLAYAPPYGQAKDPINLLGMLGANVQDGILRLWYATELDEISQTSLILDVRRDDEGRTGFIADSLHIPHTQLRERLDDVRDAAAGRPVRVLCASGVRSAIAHRILTQEGFNSASLSGGMLTLKATLGAPQHNDERKFHV